MPDKTSTTRYNKAPQFLGKGRTRFDLSHNILTTFNTGELVPILIEPIVPGSTFSLKTASLTRLETSLHQTMDNAYLEFAYFFVPSRILWQHFDQYQGFNQDAWARTTKYTKPQIILGFNGVASGGPDSVKPGSLLNHMCLPASVYPNDVNVDSSGFMSIDLLPLRAIFKTYNEYFRDENLDSEIAYSDGDSDITLSTPFYFNGSQFLPSQECLKVNRFKDLFSTSLPAPQKGDPIQLFADLSAPVGFVSGNSFTASTGTSVNAFNSGQLISGDDFVQSKVLSGGGLLAASPIFADLNQVNFTVNDLRIAIALQAMRERDARGGTRINERLYSTWHLEVNSLELDKPEFLGGKRIPVSMMEVLQTSETGTTVLGSDAGHSKTFDSDDSFVRTFTQWGYVIGFCFVRTARSYSQGIDRRFFVKDILDEYDPMLDNIGEMPVYKKEINSVYTFGGSPSLSNSYNSAKKNSVFGYQEAWYWYKERNNRYSGYFQNHINGTLDSWHYGDDYVFEMFETGGRVTSSKEPYLSPSWLKEPESNVDRTIAVSHSVENSYQWMINIHFEATNTFEASKYSLPNKFGF